MTSKNLVGGMLVFGLVTAAVAPIAAQVPGIPGPPSLGITVGIKATTLGLGLEVGKIIGPRLGVRVGVNGFNRDQSFNFSDIDYNVSLKLQTVTLLGDLYLIGPFRLSAGLVINKNQASLALDPTTPITIGSQTFQASDVGTISGTIGYAKSVAPYLGLGIGGKGRIGFIMEMGAMATGDFAITYTGTTTPSAPPAVATAFQTQITAEKTQIEADANSKKYLKYWPVFGFGLQIKF